MNIFELVEDPSKAPSNITFRRKDGECGYSEEGQAFLDQCYSDTGIGETKDARLKFWEGYMGASSWSHDISAETKLGVCEHEFIRKLFPSQVQLF